jgi:hypothetical protein
MDTSKFNVKKEWRSFGKGLALILVVIAVVQYLKHVALFPYFFTAGAIIMIVALTCPFLLKPLYILFSCVGQLLGWVMTRLILSVLFFIIFTFIGWTMRLFGKRFLDIQFPQQKTTLWIEKDKKGSNYTEQF